MEAGEKRKVTKKMYFIAPHKQDYVITMSGNLFERTASAKTDRSVSCRVNKSCCACMIPIRCGAQSSSAGSCCVVADCDVWGDCVCLDRAGDGGARCLGQRSAEFTYHSWIIDLLRRFLFFSLFPWKWWDGRCWDSGCKRTWIPLAL